MSIRLDYKQVSNALHKDSVAAIIPCYNSSKYIRKTSDSVLNQDYKYLEIVAIDDGSTDETREILESYLPKIRIMSHPNDANLGPAASQNFGITQTKSDLIAFLDHDDFWYPGKVKEQVKIFEKNPVAGVVYTNGYAVDENDKILFKLFPDNFQEENICRKILLKGYIKTESSIMVRREMFGQVGLLKTNLLAADHDLYVRLSEVTKFYYILDCLIGWRKHSGQASLRRRMWEDGFVILREACKRYPYGISVKRKRLAVLHYRLGEYDWNHKLYWKATKHFLLAGTFDPLLGVEFFLSSLFHVGKAN
jgi:glycosyltransferase involved in cell wall biosynthesis